MLKHMTRILIALAFFGVASAHAAPPAKVSGKVVAVEDGKVQIVLEGEVPAWVKANAPIKFPDGLGRVVAVSADAAKPPVATVRTKLAGKLKSGELVTFQKGSPLQGC